MSSIKTKANHIAIIPVAGIGTRLRPHTHTMPKSLIPVAGKPILGHIMDKLVAVGINEYIFVIGYLGDKIEAFIRTNYPKIDAKFVIQTIGKGVGHAIWLTKDYWGKDSNLLIIFGDTIVDMDIKKLMQFKQNAVGVMKVYDPRQFGVAEINKNNQIIKMVEKPTIPKSNLALVGIYSIKDNALLLSCLTHLIENDIKTQNEFHLTDALMMMIDQKAEWTFIEVDNWFDCGKKEIILETNQTLLKHGHYDKSKNEENIVNSILVEPVFIAHSAIIKNSIIGPYVSIGDETFIEHSILTDSIIGPHAQIEFAVLKDSLIGNDATLKGTRQSLNLGDSAEVRFS